MWIRELTKLLVRITAVVVLGGFNGGFVFDNADLGLTGTGLVGVVHCVAAGNFGGAHGCGREKGRALLVGS